MNYDSVVPVTSRVRDGVSFTISRMSFGRRVELMGRVRDLASRLEFFEAGSGNKDRIEANILSAEIDGLYLRWGLREVSGLTIDGQPATPELLASSGPEDLFVEALNAVKSECGLSEAERKNS
ncbi:MAG: hypothetical protein ACR2I2_11235 [Bryobacteraceae bacterium]